jgi:Putative zinc-finger
VSHLGQRLSALIDGELSHQQRERVLAHLAHCEPCRREAAALRALKQRMHALGEATANTALTDRLIAVAGVAGPGPWGRRLPLPGRRPGPGGSRRRWPVRSLAVTSLALAGLGVPAAAFLAGGGQQDPGPSVMPAIGVFMVQHELSGGTVPALTAAPSRGASGAPSAPAAGATAAPAVPPGLGVLTAAGAAAVSARTAALTRAWAASARAAASARVTGTSGRVIRPHPVITVAGAR